jgi:hypothetical protein
MHGADENSQPKRHTEAGILLAGSSSMRETVIVRTFPSQHCATFITPGD